MRYLAFALQCTIPVLAGWLVAAVACTYAAWWQQPGLTEMEVLQAYGPDFLPPAILLFAASLWHSHLTWK